MLDVFFTIDVEVWCDGWQGIDAKFPDAFRRYIYGPTPRGDYGLPYTLREFNAHGLLGVFFVESLFATRFGIDPLSEIIGLLRSYDQEVQLHLHTEWVDESREQLLDGVTRKRKFLREFTRNEQAKLIRHGIRLLTAAGSGIPDAFRAGSFGFNSDTLSALASNNIVFDSSYNAATSGLDSGVGVGQLLSEPMETEGVFEYPLTVFRDGTAGLRPAQITACSYIEMEGLLWQALESGRKSFVLLSHNFELLNLAKNRPDDVAVHRFERLCRFLDRNRDCFNVRGFGHLNGKSVAHQPPPLASALWKTGLRVVEQALRRRYG